MKDFYDGQSGIEIPKKWCSRITKLTTRQAGTLIAAISYRFFGNGKPEINDEEVKHLYNAMLPTIKYHEHCG